MTEIFPTKDIKRVNTERSRSLSSYEKESKNIILLKSKDLKKKKKHCC